MASRATTKAKGSEPAAPDDEGASELDRLKDELDPLYAGPPEDFVAARDALAKSLRAQRDRAGATFVKSLRRPSPAAWALNQLHTAAPDVLADWSEAAAAVQAAQRQAMAGGGHGGTLRDATRRMKAAVDRATEAAVRIAEEARRDPGAVRARAAATLHAGASDEAVADALRLGRLDRDHSVSGFGVDESAWAMSLPAAEPEPEDAAGEPEPEAAGSAQPEPDEADGAEAAEEAAAGREQARRDEVVTAARDEARAAEQAEEAARRAREEADAAADEAKAARDEAAAQLRAAEDRLRAATRAANEAVRVLRTARGALDEARRRVDQAEAARERKK